MKMKPGALDVSFRWSAQLGPGFVFYPEVEVPPGDVIGRGPLREDLEGALLSRDGLAKPDDAEFVTVEDENAQIGFVTVVVGRVFFLGFRCWLVLRRWKGASRISAGRKEQGWQEKKGWVE
jgi:hypothetical protein